MPDTIDAMAEIPAFAALVPETRAWLAAHSERRAYPRGAVVALAGDPADEVLVVVAGRLRQRLMSAEGREQVVGDVEAGNYVGLADVLDGRVHAATVDAESDTIVLAIRREVFQQLLAQAPEVAHDINQRLAARVRHLTHMVDDLALRSVDARLARFLLAHAHGREREGERILAARQWTQYEIATHIGTVRDVVGRAFRNLAREGIVRRERGRLVIANRAALERIAEG